MSFYEWSFLCARQPRSIGVKPAHPEQSGPKSRPCGPQDFNPEHSGLRVSSSSLLIFSKWQSGVQAHFSIFL